MLGYVITNKLIRVKLKHAAYTLDKMGAPDLPMRSLKPEYLYEPCHIQLDAKLLVTSARVCDWH